MKKSIYLLLAFLATFFISCKNDNSNLKDGLYADIRTPKGHIIVQLEFEKAPITVANFVSLAEGKNEFVSEQFKGKHFFDGLNFHRVEPGFVIQGGDPEGNGSGGPGYTFKDEITELKHDKPGSLSMANAGPGTNGSQFFITHVPNPQLDGGYSVFGYVTGNGMEVVNRITADDKIISINIIRNGDAAKKFDAPKVFSDYFSNKASIEKKEAEEKAKANAEVLKQFESGKTTASGIKYIVVKEGNGATPTETSNVKVHYTGTFLDGKVFDSSVQRGQPIDFNLNQVIKGWTEGVQLMKEGAKYKFYIPYQLAYGEQGFQSIPPKSDLLFEIELIKVNN